MRVITWNLHGANKESRIWDLLLELNPDIILLQEVGSMPNEIMDSFDVLSKVAIKKSGKLQRFSTAVLLKGKIIKEIELKSNHEWVDKELEFFKGNIIACSVEFQKYETFNVVSVYSPAWSVDSNRIKGIDVSQVKLTKNPEVWMSEIIWSALKYTISKDEQWIVGGDYNSSETFDRKYKLIHGIKGGIVSDGNKEIRDRMYDLGFKECLLEYNGKLTPTFRHSNQQIIHQLDHLYVLEKLFSRIEKCEVGDQNKIFSNSLSDHLPIIADFKV
tara:strand:- start:121 stop:939 length:819 start_codon:yes stop_codon:yes gene_type:complete